MSILIALDNAPEFFTNLDFVRGRIILQLTRPEAIGAIVVKLEGESQTSLGVPTWNEEVSEHGPGGGHNDGVAHENHKVLYKVQQVFPDDKLAALPEASGPFYLQPGRHEYPFRFKVPFNNACSDPAAMARLGGIANAGGFGSGVAGQGLLGLGGIRVMDGSKQLMYQHVTRTLPPSFTGFPRQAEVRYFVKVTIQRPGLFKENWRYQVGLKFLPIEPPRPKPSNQEAFARRPFTFRPRAERRRSSAFNLKGGKNSTMVDDEKKSMPQPPPNIEMSARLPYPNVLTCNQPIPLRLLAKKLSDAAPPQSLSSDPRRDDVYLVGMQLDLVGTTHVRCHDLRNNELSRWVVASATLGSADLPTPILVARAADPAGTEVVLPNHLWASRTLPNTVAPSFVTCNLGRSYELEVKLSLSWGAPPAGVVAKGKDAQAAAGADAQMIHLPLHFSKVDVFSGIAPPQDLLDAMAAAAATTTAAGAVTITGPVRPPRRPTGALNASASSSTSYTSGRPVQQGRPQQQPAAHDPLYPPQLAPGQTGAPSALDPDAPPPSYDEAMAESMPPPAAGPGQRPAYSGVTNENAPPSMPSKG